MNLYRKLKDEQQAKYNDFSKQYMFYAFSNDQYDDGMQKLGLDPAEDRDKVKQTIAGGFILKEHYNDMLALLESFTDETKAACAADRDGTGFIVDMFRDEMANHEYGYTGDLSDTIAATPYTVTEIMESPNLKHGLEVANAQYMTDYSECN